MNSSGIREWLDGVWDAMRGAKSVEDTAEANDKDAGGEAGKEVAEESKSDDETGDAVDDSDLEPSDRPYNLIGLTYEILNDSKMTVRFIGCVITILIVVKVSNVLNWLRSLHLPGWVHDALTSDPKVVALFLSAIAGVLGFAERHRRARRRQAVLDRERSKMLKRRPNRGSSRRQ